MFITFEGIEGSGKSSVLTRLADHLRAGGLDVVATREPGGSRLGQDLRAILLAVDNRDLTSEAELFLYLADRAQHVAQVVRPALSRGCVVLCDRYADSTVVYQGYGRGLDPVRLHEFNDVAVAGLWPDLTILMDLPAEQGLNRALARNRRERKHVAEGRFEAEALEFHRRVRQGYLNWAAIHRERFHVVNASLPEEAVFTAVRDIVAPRLASD